MPLYCSFALVTQASSLPCWPHSAAKTILSFMWKLTSHPRLIIRKQELIQCPPLMNAAITHSYSHSSPLLTVPGYLGQRPHSEPGKLGDIPAVLTVSASVRGNPTERSSLDAVKQGQYRIRVSAAWAFRYKLWNPRTTLFQFS